MNRTTMRRALALIGLAIAMVIITVPAAFEALDRRYPPPLGRLADLSVEVVDREGRLLRAFANDEDRWRLELALDDVDPRFTDMLLAYEDKRFWDHPGVDPMALARAAWQCATRLEIVSGGSTITMQLARLIEPSGERSIRVKLLQIFRAIQIEDRLEKREILRLYLTLAPYGGNIEGLRAASLAYFGREPNHLPPAMAAMLVALPQSPEARRPDNHPAAARASRDRVLQRLALSGVLEEDVAAAAMRDPAPSRRIAIPALAPHLANRLASAAGEGVHRIETTLDGPLQSRLEALAAEHSEKLGPKISAAILVADHETGEVLARVGSPGLFDWAREGAVDMTGRMRSPGSTLKPLIYGLGLEQGLIAPATLIDDRPTRFAGYAPENFDLTFQGTVTIREALAQSLNVPAVAVLDAIGPQLLMARLRRAGAEPLLPSDGAPGLAIGLGGVGLTLEDLVGVYAAIARGGRAVALTDRLGEGTQPHVGGEDTVMSAAAAFDIREILRAVAPPPGAAGGTIAYKTGTSYGYRDAWAIGFDGRHVIGVWIGRADGTPVPGLSSREGAAPILFDAFARIGTDRVAFAGPPQGYRSADASDLPHALRHFVARGDPEAGSGIAPLVLAFPPDGARLDRADAGIDAPLVLKAEGGILPLAWYANGRPLEGEAHRRAATWQPDGPGFASLTVVDAAGRSANAGIFIDASH